MSALAQMLFAKGLPQVGGSLNATASRGATAPTAAPQGFMRLWQQMLPGGGSESPIQQLWPKGEEPTRPVMAMLDKLLGAPETGETNVRTLEAVPIPEEVSLSIQVTLPADQSDITVVLPEQLEAPLQQSPPTQIMPPSTALTLPGSSLSVEQIGAESQRLSAVGFLQLNLQAAGISIQANQPQQWQLLLPVTNEAALPVENEVLPVLLVGNETSAGGSQPVVLPATIELSESELPRITKLLQQVQQQLTPESKATTAEVLPNLEPRTSAATAAVSTDSKAQAQPLPIPDRLPLQEPISITTKLTIDTKVLDQLLTQTVQQNSTQVAAARPEATPLQSLPQAPVVTQQDSTLSALPQHPASPATLIVESGNATGGAFIDLGGNSHKDAPQTQLPGTEAGVGPVNSAAAPAESFATSVAQAAAAPHATVDDKWDDVRIHFSQAQLNTLLKRGEVKMQLSPPELGEMKVELRTHADQITARFELRSEAARQIVEQNLPHLRESLERAGIRIGQFEVALSSDGQQRQATAHSYPGMQNFVRQDSTVELEAAVEPEERRITHLGRVNLIA